MNAYNIGIIPALVLIGLVVLSSLADDISKFAWDLYKGNFRKAKK